MGTHPIIKSVVNRSTIDQQVIDDTIRITGESPDYVPLDARELCNKIFHTCYMGTENSSPETRKRAKDLASAIGSSVSKIHSPSIT
jgi:NAD+ synthase (glutamine-hydrolysing)